MPKRPAIEEGQRFGLLVALEDVRIAQVGKFLCDCGRTVERKGKVIKSSTGLQTCGCQGRSLPEAGWKRNKLTLVESPTRRTKKYKFLCDCGRLHQASISDVELDRVKSCGCNHGMSGTRVYNVWTGMKQRCNYPKHVAYGNYGGRGIKVCEEWDSSFEAFYRDMGDPPEDCELDRINNDLGYSKDNCRWVRKDMNMNNTRKNREMTCYGETKTMSEWAADHRCAVSYRTLNVRTTAGWDDERAITEPLHQSKKNQWAQ